MRKRACCCRLLHGPVFKQGDRVCDDVKTKFVCRSPAEGAYSEGFISSKLNQEYCIVCPGTGSTFNFRSGEIVDW